MLYAILCYNDENTISNWTPDEEEACISALEKAQEPLAKAGRLGPVARLMPTTAAITLRKDQDPPVVLDGPFAETKEALLGFYVIDCNSLDDALEVAKDLGRANPGGAFEVRPLLSMNAGTLKT